MWYGYKPSAEQFAPRELIDYSRLAEELELSTIAVSDHFQPWRHQGGHTPAVLPWMGALGERTSSALLGTSVLTPTMRYHLSVVAQAFATLACLNPGRVFLGVGTGEALNETPATGAEWPGAKPRRMMMRESIELMRRLWAEERVTFDGEYYKTDRATIYDRPDEPIPVYGAAGGQARGPRRRRVDRHVRQGPKALQGAGRGARRRGRVGGARRGGDRPLHRDQGVLRPRRGLRQAGLSLLGAAGADSGREVGIDDAAAMEEAADRILDRAHTRFIVSDDPDEVVDRIAPYVDFGFNRLVMHGPGHDQERFLRGFCSDVLPRLRQRFGG